MTGSASDPADWQPHIRNKARREALAKRFRDAERPVQDRHRARHVADRLRRALPAHDVCRQADARPRADAGHRPRQPRVQGQARRPGRRLPGAGRTNCKQALATYTESGGTGRDGARPGRGGRLDAGEVRDLPRVCSTASTGRSGRPARRSSGSACCRAAQEHILAQEDGKDRFLRGTRAVAGVRAGGAARRGTAHPRRRRRSSRPCGPCLPRARPASARPTRNSTTPSARSSRGRWRPRGVIDIFAAAG